MSRLVVGPFNRVEGDLEVRLDMSEGQVQSAQVVAPMYRGFEPMLLGRDPLDALVIVPRICGICSVSQGVAAAYALGDAAGLQMPPNGQHALNLMLGCENAADHLTHFYLFFMPDFCRPVYAAQPWFEEVQRRFAAQLGEHSRLALAARQRWLSLMGHLGGKWPHTQSVMPGGSTRALSGSETLRLLAKVRELRAFIEHPLLDAPSHSLLALRSGDELAAWAEGKRGDLALWLRVATSLDLARAGPGPGRFLSYGAYRQPDGRPWWPQGVWHAGLLQPLDTTQIREDLSHAWLADPEAQAAPRHPYAGLTLPDIHKAEAYSWNKAPRLDGQVVETGAIARQLAAGQPLIQALVAQHGASVLTRVLARLLELVQLVPAMETWLQALRPSEPYHQPHRMPAQAEACGLNEAARGALGHWLRIEDGRLSQYQIIAPTSWNFSPRDAQGQPGALEQALVGARLLPGEGTPVAVQHIVRSFDPCMVCTVH